MIRNSHQHGLVLIWVAVLLMVFIGFVGLAIDTWYTALTAQQLQVGADAGALAGAWYIRSDQALARTRAAAVAAANSAGGKAISLSLNSGNAAGGDIVIGRFDSETGVFLPTTDDPNAIQVNAARQSGSGGGPLGLLFGPAFGVSSASVQRTATAVVGGDRNLGLLVLSNAGKGTLNVGGTSSALIINNGAIYVNSSDPKAANANGNPTIITQEVLIHGGMDPSFAKVTVNAQVYTGVDRIIDPLAGLPEPNRPLVPGIDVKVNPNTTVALVPGFYKSITQSGGTITMAPGLYYVDGPFKIGGNLTALNVMVFLGPNGSLEMTGDGTIVMTPMTTLSYLPTGPAIPTSLLGSRVLIFQARNNPSNGKITGSSGMTLDGRIYMPNHNATLTVGGGGAVLGSGMIMGRISVQGNGNVVNAIPFPVPTVKFVFLVL
jgi:Flp pilus assembly protein TadG